MKTILTYIILVGIIVVGGFFIFTPRTHEEKHIIGPLDHKNATYIIDGRSIRLTDGVASIKGELGETSRVDTRYFGNEVRHDLDGDGREDVVFLVVQETGGTGVFYYVVAALNTIQGYVGSEGVFLGDRIAPQNTHMGKGQIIVVNYADRAPGESFVTEPSVGKSISLLFNPKTLQFGEVAENFEGEADPNRMTLDMKSWNWINASYNDGTVITPKKQNVFSLIFSKENRFSAKTDCNSLGGAYAVNQKKVAFSNIFSTKMYCEGSQEQLFTELLTDTQSYMFTSRGELVFELKGDKGTVTFR
jgi:heat shock protein HslJ